MSQYMLPSGAVIDDGELERELMLPDGGVYAEQEAAASGTNQQFLTLLGVGA